MSVRCVCICLGLAAARALSGLQRLASSEDIDGFGGGYARLASLLTLGLVMLSMGTLQPVRAQQSGETKLPGITVEGGGGSKKKVQNAPPPKQAAKPAPAPA